MNVARIVAAAVVTAVLALGAVVGIDTQTSPGGGHAQWANGPVPAQTGMAGNSGDRDPVDVTWGS
ncbi:hypothetical protein [Streptomyces sp. NPDC055085]